MIWSSKAEMQQMNRKGNHSTEGKWNQISFTLRFLPRAHWLTKNAAPDNLHYRSNLSLFSFSSHSHPLVFLSFSFFPYSPHFPSLYLCRWAVWPVKGKRAVPVVSVQRRRREETQSGSSGSWTCSWDIQQKGNAEVQIQYRYYVCVCLFGGWGCKVVVCRTRLWVLHDLLLE